jgi:chitin binding peritrophin-A-like protein with CBM14 domain
MDSTRTSWRAAFLAVVAATGMLSGAGAATATVAPTPAPPAPSAAPGPDPVLCRATDREYSNPVDPESFYHCDQAAVPHLVRCPPGTRFNEAVQYCDLPENVPESAGVARLTPPTRNVGLLTTSFAATYRDTAGAPIAGTGITFHTPDGAELCRAVTDAAGTASCGTLAQGAGTVDYLLGGGDFLASVYVDIRGERTVCGVWSAR